MAGHRIYLVPGFFGFTNLGDLRYFGHVREALGAACAARGAEAEVHIVRTHPTASLPRRAARVLETLAETGAEDGGPVHFVGHSSGGLDARLLLTPGALLPTERSLERHLRGVRTLVTVSTPHHGTPLAEFFTSLLGKNLLQVLSLSTIAALRFGRLPLSVLLHLGALFARLDDRVGLNSALLDELFGQLLERFTGERRAAVEALFHEVGTDQALLPQLTPDGLEVFNAATRDRPGVRYGSVVTRALPPGVRSAFSAGLDPAALASHAVYQALYRLAARTPRDRAARPGRAQARALRHAYGTLPAPSANDGVVPTLSQVWGEVVHAARGDHLDVIGHFDDPLHVPPHFDWLATGTGFTRAAFEALWQAVAAWMLDERSPARIA